MKVINISVDENTYDKLLKGDRGFDVRLDVPKHEVGDLLIYHLLDEDGLIVEGSSLAFLIQTKAKLEEFVERIGEQMMRRSDRDSEELVIVTLSPVPGQRVE